MAIKNSTSPCPFERTSRFKTAAIITFALTFLPFLSAQATELEIFPESVKLVGSDALQTLLITASDEKTGTPAARRDVTREASFSSSDESVARVRPDGVIVPAGNGTTSVSARVKDTAIQVQVVVSDYDTVSRINFTNDITPILTREGCNSGECHGKTGGQNGFQLSLLGYDPKTDHGALAYQALGRRVVLSAPEESLILLKATVGVEHEGGKRFATSSSEYRTILRWIKQGMPFSHPEDTHLVRVSVTPEQRILSSGGKQQLVVSAFYSDGTRQDVTRHTQFLSSDDNSVPVDARGLISVPSDGKQRAASAAIMARYRGKIAIARISVPRPGPPPDGPSVEARNFIDRIVFANLRELGISQSEVCDDYTFIRRASIDIVGKLPTPVEVRGFVANTAPDKRQRLVQGLLERPEYASYWTLIWSDLLQNTRAKLNGRGMYAFHRWIHDSVSRNKALDQFVRELLAARGSNYENGAANYLRMFKDPTEASVAVSQAFLGIRLDCARCHHHPFDRWGQEDFYGFAAHFARIKRKSLSEFEEVLLTASTGEVTHPLTEEPVAPRFLGMAQQPESGGPRREALAAWLTARDNPYFARSLANRIWKHFTGTGVVEPVDDLRETNPPSNPQLLDELANALVSCGFDLKEFIKVITNSHTYQLSSKTNPSNREDRRNFSHAAVKRMPAEVLFDAIAQTTGTPQKLPGVPLGTRAVELPDNRTQSYFLDLFGRPKRESPCDCERADTPSISQVLHLMNSPEIQRQIENSKGRAATLAASSRKDREVVEELYLACYARRPQPAELERALSELQGSPERRVVLEDILWALMNAPEFVFNR